MMDEAPAYRDSGLARPATRCERRPDGSLRLEALDEAPPSPQLGISGFVARWAQERGEQAAFSERDGPGRWRTLSWAELQRQMLALAARLLELGLSQTRPLLILSGNSIEHALLVAAAEYVGIPSAPLSPSHSLAGSERARLRDIRALLEPGAVFVQSAERFASAVQALGLPAGRVIGVSELGPGQREWRTLVEHAPSAAQLAAVQAARARIDPIGDVARVFFTSGSTGAPKGVPITYGNIAAQIANALYFHRATRHDPLVLLDWLPWSHVFGGLGTLCRVFALGGSYHLDDGRPLPEQFARSVQNLREIAPTVYTSVPAAFALLAAELERDDGFARAFFARLKYAGFGGASLPRDVWQRFQAAAVRATGQRIVFVSAYGSTETSGGALQYSEPVDDIANVGVPNPGVAVKLVPLDGGDGRYEIRIRGQQIFRGYLGAPTLTAAAFDEEGFYRLGDAVRLVDPAAPQKGLRYAGRCAEDFKLTSGTWVRTGSVRVGLLELCAPLLDDAIVCGHDRTYIAALAWPNVAACRALAPELAGASVDDLVAHPLLVAELRSRLRRQPGAVSQRVQRLLLLAEPPSRDASEVTDKGYINQAVARERRAASVDRLYAEPRGTGVAGIE